MTQFTDLNLDPKVLRAVTEAGYETPTPIQAGAIPEALAGRDVLGIAQTGTGKTASFTLPMIHKLARGRARARMPRSLVLCPTRELAAQVAENFDTYSKNVKLTKALLIGGVSFKEQDTLIDKGVDVLIATPGRLLDHFERGKLLLTGIEIMVVDEADRMLDMGFIPDIERIFGLLTKSYQTLFFSATMAPEIERITRTFLKDPARIEVARQATASETIAQGVVIFKGSRKDREASEKRALLRALIDREGEALTNAIIFCNRKSEVDIVAKSLTKNGYNAAPIHGDLDQSQRTRTLDGFREGTIRLLIASDVAARGLDIPAVSHVINFDVPSHAEDYVHRIGRTGRAGRSGKAFTICQPRDEKYLDQVEALLEKQIPRIELPNAGAAPSGESEAAETGRDDSQGDRPRRTRSRRSRSRMDEDTPQQVAAEEENAQDDLGDDIRDRRDEALQDAPREDRPRRNRRGDRPGREQANRDRTPRDQEDRDQAGRDQPAKDRTEGARGDRSRGDRGGRGDRQGRNEPQVVGMGDDVPAFIAQSFAERRSE
ncbi:DEAD/DEAH box helicase [Wenxinia saemankumensis]|uniref:DEAD-box ATP-dependent RNA helicase RhpA n=1 Tax=Wenxinia saemankumensis TaxID=1447782 RepID=A0A1M6ALZ0_9RHOB|nr:DEAD/DEAH box helicase [Wenxinia saemankumensis]SHI37519.1 ATP-dependent RNA helicase RhlE [Wenxinia saemankumensis]